MLIGLAAVLLVVLFATAGMRVFRIVTSSEQTRMPGSVTIDCTEGEVWRVGPATGRSARYGPVTVNTNRTVHLEEVSVVFDDESVQVTPMVGGAVETWSYFGTTFTAVASFACPASGLATVTFSGPAGAEAAVFPTFGRVLRTLAVFIGGLVVVLAMAPVGIVLAVRHRRSLQPTWPPAA